MKQRIFGSKMNVAKNVIKTPTQKGDDWAKALMSTDLTEIGPVVTIRLKHGKDPQSKVPRHLSDYIYGEIYQWLSLMRQHMHIARVVMPSVSINGTWPPVDQLSQNIRDLGLHPMSDTENESMIFFEAREGGTRERKNEYQ